MPAMSKATFCQQQEANIHPVMASKAAIPASKSPLANSIIMESSGNELVGNDCGKVASMMHQQHQQQQHKLAKIKEEFCDTVACDKDGRELEGRVDSFDHVTFWVGNAKQSAVFYMTQFGFQPLAFRGLETGSRDLACHVVKLNDTIIQFVSAVEPNNATLNKFLLSHGDAVKDVAFRVSNIESLLEHSLKQGAELVNPLEVITFGANGRENELDKFVLKRATIKTFGDVTHTFIERNYEYGPANFLPGYSKASLQVSLFEIDVL